MRNAFGTCGWKAEGTRAAWAVTPASKLGGRMIGLWSLQSPVMKVSQTVDLLHKLLVVPTSVGSVSSSSCFHRECRSEWPCNHEAGSSFPLVSETMTALFGFVQGMFFFKLCISLLVSGVNYGLDLVVSLHKDASRQTPFARTEGSFTVGHTVAVMNLTFTLCMI